MFFRSNIPNFLTIGNLLFGIMGIHYAHMRNWEVVAFAMAAALLLDVLDGMIARLLKVGGEFGKQLDSLADVVSFGVLPGFILYFLSRDLCKPWGPSQELLPLLAFLVPAAAAWRLATFNIDQAQSKHFKGLASPANAMLILGLVFWQEELSEWGRQMEINPALFFLAIGLFGSALMLSKIALPGFKNLNEIRGRAIVLSVLIIGLVLFLLIGLKSLSIVILLYLLSGMIFYPQKPDTHEV